MDSQKLIAELRSQLEQITQAISTLERLAGVTAAKRRGRPPKALAAARAAGTPMAAAGAKPAKGKKRNISPESRQKMTEAQKKRWAAAKEAKG